MSPWWANTPTGSGDAAEAELRALSEAHIRLKRSVERGTMGGAVEGESGGCR